jgi:uncharacterized membrane protein YjjP (DUF1212 family)
MRLDPKPREEQPEPNPPAYADPIIILVVAAACAGVAGHLTDWQTAVTVFLAVISVFKPQGEPPKTQ